MQTNSFDRLERLFSAARVLSGAERSSFIDAACGDDNALRNELIGLLEADESADVDSFLSSDVNVAEKVFSPNGSLEGQRIGPYKLIEPLGEGGMGEVWLGEQKEPIKRQVAVKVVKLGMDTKEVVARFESERQALAVMNHPNIAKVFDAGITDSGRPYFVMELVRGVPVNEYCDQKRLSTADRIALFMDICRAVQHAHQKGIIHRDLKPTNVLVTEHDDKPVPKVIDFGIAKAVGFTLTSQTLITGLGQMIGTPAYMSPEQASMPGMDIDTRTDVYSLGVMLYELLVGARPIDFKQRAQAAIREVIQDSQVPKPSTRLTSLGQKQKSIAEFRQTTPDRLRKELKGDLDWIVLKSIEKDRTRRYETVNGLKMELKRYLSSEPVIARPPSMGYRMQKFVERHRTGVVTAVAVVLALVGGITAASIGLVRAQIAEAEAQKEAATATSVSDFLVDLFEVSDPSVSQGNTITAREILDQGAERIEGELQDQPEVRARLLHTMGQVYWELGIEDKATEFLEESIELKEEVLGAESRELAQSLQVLAEVKGRHFGEISMETREEIMALLERSRQIHENELGPNAPEVAEDWMLISRFAVLRPYREDPVDHEKAIFAAESALSIFEQAYSPEDARLAPVLYTLGMLYRNEREEYDLAAQQFERAADVIEGEHGPEDGRLLEPLYGLYRLEDQKDAESERPIEVFRRMWAISDEELLTKDTNVSLFITASSYLLRAGYKEEAEASLKRAARLIEQKYGSDVEDMVFAHMRIGQLYISQGRWQEAEQKALWTKPLWEQNENYVSAANALYYAGVAQAGQEKYEEAEQSFLKALETYEERSQRFDLPTTLWELGRVQRLQGKIAQAEETESRLLAASLKATTNPRARDADWRFYALALLGCREFWKIRTPYVHCYGSPSDPVAAMEYAKKAIEFRLDSHHNLAVLALAHYHNGEKDEAVQIMQRAISMLHPKDPTVVNYEGWVEKFEG
ncbi:MAG: protein kinase [Rhodothermaceae bacterium]|nr:protein kinase [Rhodothermaceae bacterium]